MVVKSDFELRTCQTVSQGSSPVQAGKAFFFVKQARLSFSRQLAAALEFPEYLDGLNAARKDARLSLQNLGGR